MMQNFKRRKIRYEKHYELFFADKIVNGAGWGFECDEFGNVSEKLSAAGQQNLNLCLSGENNNRKGRVVAWDKRVVTPASGDCSCGERIYLTNVMYNTCEKCGAEYNSSGQKLAARCFWGEDTGEHLSDILRHNDLIY
jgi:hypothetical protein